jgi:competence protein ComEC
VPYVLGVGLSVGLDRIHPWPLLLSALVLSALACRLARKREAYSLACLAAAAFLAAPAWEWQRRGPVRELGWLPARDTRMDLRLDYILPGATSADRFAAFATVLDSEEPLAQLRSLRIFVSGLPAPGSPPKPGATYRMRGILRMLETRPERRSFDAYLRTQGVLACMDRTRIEAEVMPPGHWHQKMAELRRWMEAMLERGLEHRKDLSGLYSALMLGAKHDLEPASRSAYERTGTLHLFAISGMNIGVIALGAAFVLRLLRLPPLLATALGLAWAAVFVAASGPASSAVRALIMALTAFAAHACCRDTNGLALWTFSAVPVVLLEPAILGNTGFQLSYGVVAGLVVFAEPASRFVLGRLAFATPARLAPRSVLRSSRDWAIRGLVGGGVASLTAMLCTLPTAITSFGGFSLGSVLGNLILVPLASFVVLCGLAALASGAVAFESGMILANSSAGLALQSMDGAARLLSRIPAQYWYAEWRWEWAGDASLALLVLLLATGCQRRWSPRWLLGLFPAVVSGWILLAARLSLAPPPTGS